MALILFHRFSEIQAKINWKYTKEKARDKFKLQTRHN